jgi:hypothetical protein
MPNPTKELLAEIEAFLKRTGMPPSAFGWATLGDPNLVRTLKMGRELKYRTLLRIKKFITAFEREPVSRL